MNVHVKETGGRPVVVHGHGNHDLKPIFDHIRTKVLESPATMAGPCDEVTLFTCNNGHSSLGLFESSAERLGQTVMVAGKGRSEWSNAVDKPAVILEVIRDVDSEYVLYSDSRDCLLLRPVSDALLLYQEFFGEKELVFGADIVNWPPERRFQRYEMDLAEGTSSRYRFLNGGCWMGRTEFCRKFFERAARVAPSPKAPDSEQGLLKALLPEFPSEVALDYRARLFFNCGFVAGDIIEFED